MRFHEFFVICTMAAVAALAAGQKLSYSENPNNFNCKDEVIEYTNPAQFPSDQNVRTREVKSSYVYYGTPQEQLPSKYVMKYSPVKKYYTPVRKDSRFYQAFQPAGEKSFDQINSGIPISGSKSPAIQIYVV